MYPGVDAGFRIEKDMLGEKQVPADAYYGIHTARAMENFSVSGRKTNRDLVEAMILVKKAAALTHLKLNHYSHHIGGFLVKACDSLLEGAHKEEFTVDAYQGGAGTSLNMNVNEVIANLALEYMGYGKGTYDKIHPLHHVNCCQSTNDVFPTALRIAAIKQLSSLSESFASLQQALQEKENQFADVIKLGRTQLMDALPMTAGQGFGAYARAIGRDRWRLYKAEERLREVNIGGTAIGTGMNASYKYIFIMTETLQEITGLGLARSEYPMDTTQNMDVFVEVSGLLKAAAVNLMKIAGDIRLLASGPLGGLGEIDLMPVQAGSSIMPGKVNPVLPEMMTQICLRVIANDAAITGAAALGQLELNAFLPLIGENLLESMELLNKGIVQFENKCIKNIKVNEKRCQHHVEKSTALAAALIHHIGYENSYNIAKRALKEEKTVRQIINEDSRYSGINPEKILAPKEIIKPGIPGKGAADKGGYIYEYE